MTLDEFLYVLSIGARGFVIVVAVLVLMTVVIETSVRYASFDRRTRWFCEICGDSVSALRKRSRRDWDWALLECDKSIHIRCPAHRTH